MDLLNTVDTVDEKVNKLFDAEETINLLSKFINDNGDIEDIRVGFNLAVQDNQKIKDLPKEAILQGLKNVVGTGLSLDPQKKHLYLIPYGGKLDCQISVHGYRELLYRGGANHVETQVVFENDNFEMTLGSENKIKHSVARGERGEIDGVYAIVNVDGHDYMEYMDKKQIEKVRSKSKGGNVWKDFPDEMARKSVLRRLFKTLGQKISGMAIIAASIEDEMIEADVVDESLPSLNLNNSLEYEEENQEEDSANTVETVEDTLQDLDKKEDEANFIENLKRIVLEFVETQDLAGLANYYKALTKQAQEEYKHIFSDAKTKIEKES